MSKRALITGASGQDGTYLAQYLESLGYEIYGLIRGQNNPRKAWASALAPSIKWIEGDLQDFSSLVRAVEVSQPHEIYNLAAVSFVGLSWKSPELTSDVTGLGVLRMLEASRIATGGSAKFYQASSSEMFGKVQSIPQDEKTPFYPRSPYGVAKAYGHYISVNYRESHNMFVCSGILFNHECVPSGTPVVIRKNGIIDIRDIDELVPHRADPRSGTRYTSDGGGLEVWDGSRWAKCTARTATWHEEEIITIQGRGGVVTATSDHVVICPNGEKPSSEFKVGDDLVLASLPEYENRTVLTIEEAWFLGIMTADGSVSDRRARLSNLDTDILAKAKKCWESITAGYVTSSNSTCALSGNPIGVLDFRGASDYVRLLRSELYNEDKSKRIPARILNSSREVQTAFLAGFNDGDGLKAGSGSREFRSFRTVSTVLAAGLVFLAKRALNLDSSVYLQDPSSISSNKSWLINLKSSEVGGKGAHLRRSPTEVRSVSSDSYKGWMFDLETDSGVFSAGVGGVVIHNSPRRGPEFVTRKITLAAARIARGLQDSLSLGNLNPRRDWGHAYDYVRAMHAMLQQDSPDDYVVGTGEDHSILEVLDIAFDEAGLGSWNRYVKLDPRFSRPAEVNYLIADPSKARDVLGWRPTISFDNLIRDMVRHDLAAIDDPKHSMWVAP